MSESIQRPTLSIGILTLNEAHRIERCIASARFADQIIVVDSGSTDGTRELAAELGAEVVLHADWRGFAEQRNRLMAYVNTDYIFFLDADEVIPLDLKIEIEQAVASCENLIWRVYWVQVAFGRVLDRMARNTGGMWRMFRTDNLLRHEGVVHEHAVVLHVNTPVKDFRSSLPHYSRDTVYSSLLKLAQYAQLGALRRAQAGKRGGVMRGIGSALSNFVRLYVFRRGFLCGPQGFLFCFLVALECFFRYSILEYDSDLRDHGTVKR